MKLDYIDKLRLKLLYQTIHVLVISMWLNVLYEYYGPIRGWSAALTRALEDDFMDKKFKIKEFYAFLKRYAYTDYSDKKEYPYKPLLLTHTFTALSGVKAHKIIKYFPMIYRVKTINHTNKNDYKTERFNYKLYHRIAGEGSDIKTQYYKEYKTLAKKYSWPYILNSDDTEE